MRFHTALLRLSEMAHDCLSLGAREDRQFRGAYWEHFNDRDPCGKHSIVGDHYHIAVTRQRPLEGEASSSALGCWVRDKAKGYGTETLEGQNIFKPSGLFLYLRRPPRSLAYYTKSIKDLVFEKNGYKYLHHVPLEPGSLPEVPGVDEGCSGAGALFDPGRKCANQRWSRAVRCYVRHTQVQGRDHRAVPVLGPI